MHNKVVLTDKFLTTIATLDVSNVSVGNNFGLRDCLPDN